MQPQSTTVLNLVTYPTRLAKVRIVAHCVLDGNPLSKQRPRFNRRDGTVFTPQETRQREQTVGVLVRSQMGAAVLDGRSAFGVRAVFYVGTKQRKDVDNMMKLLFDGITGIAWVDDSQVREMMGWVWEDPEYPRTEFVVYRLPALLDRREAKCVVCGLVYRSFPSWKHRQYCSKACAAEGARTGDHLTCAHCGTAAYRPAGWLKNHRGDRFYCSKACLTAGTVLDLTCMRCGTTFRRARSLVKSPLTYCSQACAFADRRGLPRSLAGRLQAIEARR